MKIAHTSGERKQSVKEHLENVADLARQFAEKFDCGGYAYQIGLAHDIGKYSDGFQDKIMNDRKTQIDHSTAGAKELQKLNMITGAFAVAGHHGGLPDGGSSEESCLLRRLKKQLKHYENYEFYINEISLHHVDEKVFQNKFSTSFLIRMIFSCLVDADFLDTEDFMQNGTVERSGYDNIQVLYHRLQTYISGWLTTKNPVGSINESRTHILQQCITAGKGERGLYSLTVPTGAGKTVSSLAFALEHACAHSKEYTMKRIIYVIPYTSIIEQNAKIFGDILGDKNVVEHHANANLEEDSADKETLKLHQLSTENWDAPIIVTTNVQFFESFYSNKTSRCRKLHNIANSIVIFDEAQMIPLDKMQPCVRVIKELVEHFGVTAVMCTATQPSLNRWFEPLTMNEICNDYKELSKKFCRTTIKNIGKMDLKSLSDLIMSHKQVLVIVNNKLQAQEIYNNIAEEGTYHLSTYMYPEHRTRTIEEIRKRLQRDSNGDRTDQICRVVSTSLIEAGVDVDFPCVYRAEAGLDSIIQAAGRCNREGKDRIEDSYVYVFEPNRKAPVMIQKNIAMMNEAVNKYGTYDALDAIKYYFEQLQNLDISYLDQLKIIESFEKDREGIRWPFKTVSEVFKMINSNTKMIIIPKEDKANVLLNELIYKMENGKNYKSTLRELGKYSINMFVDTYDKMLNKDFVIHEIQDGIAVLDKLKLYDDKIGLNYVEGNGALFV